MTGAGIVAEARGWIGTPFVHQASCNGAGADCLGLVRGIWRAVYGAEPATLPPYAPVWSDRSLPPRLLAALRAHFIEVGTVEVGDVLALALPGSAVARHLAVVSQTEPPAQIIHAYSGRGVVETPLGPGWQKRIVGIFRFPNRSD